MDAHKSIRARLIGHLCPLAVTDIYIIFRADHQNLITAVCQLLFQLQSHLQGQLILCQAAGRSRGSGGHLRLRLTGSRSDRLLPGIAVGLMSCVDGHQIAGGQRVLGHQISAGHIAGFPVQKNLRPFSLFADFLNLFPAIQHRHDIRFRAGFAPHIDAAAGIHGYRFRLLRFFRLRFLRLFFFRLFCRLFCRLLCVLHLCYGWLLLFPGSAAEHSCHRQIQSCNAKYYN